MQRSAVLSAAIARANREMTTGKCYLFKSILFCAYDYCNKIIAFRAGVYNWSYSGGDFDVVFRPHGVFYCGKYPGKAKWEIVDTKLMLNWGKFGSYEFQIIDHQDIIEGHAVGAPTNWRKIAYKRDFNPTERALLGDGYGTVWNFEYAKGSFEVEFHTDSYNHFVCKQYPAHSHWLSTDDGLVQIFWGQYGDYEMRLNGSMFEGCKSGQPTNWRKMHFVRSLTADCGDVPGHDHSHDHKH